MRGTDEAPVVRRPFDLEHRVVHLAAGPRQRLLQLRLVVDMARAGVLDLLGERRHDRRLDLLEPVLEIERSHRRLEHGREDVSAP